MKMKKILSVMLVLCMLFTGCFMLFSCGGPEAGQEPEKKLTVEDLEKNPTLIAAGAAKALTSFFDVAGIGKVVDGMNKGGVSLIVDNEMLKDEIISQSGLPAAKVSSLLTMLQIKGIVADKPGNIWVLK